MSAPGLFAVCFSTGLNVAGPGAAVCSSAIVFLRFAGEAGVGTREAYAAASAASALLRLASSLK